MHIGSDGNGRREQRGRLTVDPFFGRCVARGLLLLFCIWLFSSFEAIAAPALVATRVWPAQEYTRVTFEAKEPIKHYSQTLKNPERLVIDLEGLDINAELTDLATRDR